MNSFSKQAISILYVIDGLEFGGGERVFLQIMKGLSAKYSIFAAGSPYGRYAAEAKGIEIQFCPINLERRNILKAVYKIKRFIEKNNIEIIHSQGARADFISRIAGKLASVRVNICTIAMPVEGFDEMVMDDATLCDSCQQEIAAGEKVQYHLRMGKVYCTACQRKWHE